MDINLIQDDLKYRLKKNALLQQQIHAQHKIQGRKVNVKYDKDLSCKCFEQHSWRGKAQVAKPI